MSGDIHYINSNLIVSLRFSIIAGLRIFEIHCG